MRLQIADICSTVTEEQKREIKDFLTAKRKKIIMELAQHKRLSHGELALLVGSTPTSLYNILQKFDKFKYELIYSENVGKYRYYSLTELGEAFILGLDKGNQVNETRVKTVLQQEGGRLLQKSRECLKKFRNIYEEEWGIRLDDILLKLTEHNVKDLDESINIIDDLIANIELMILQGYEPEINKVMKFLESDILWMRLEQVLEDFYSFLPIIKRMREDGMIYEIYDELHEIVKGKRAIDKKVQEKNTNEKLFETISKIKEHSVKYELSKRDIYNCLMRYLLEDKQMGAFLACEIWSELENREL